MGNWGKKNKKYKKYCKKYEKMKIKKTRKKPRYQVDALTLHKKMPYIWRFLKPEVRKQMIVLAKKPVSELNIPGMIYV
jgi:hypothetical protein